MKALHLFIVLFTILCIRPSASAQVYTECNCPCEWGYFITGSTETVLMQATLLLLNGDTIMPTADLEIYIGAFYDSLGVLRNAGSVKFEGSPTALSVFGTEYGSTIGMAPEEIIKWRLCLHDLVNNTVNEVDMNAAFDLSYSITGNYETNGIASLLVLSNQNILTPAEAFIDIRIFPNPAEGFIKLEGIYQFQRVEILTISGKKVQSVDLFNNSSVELDLSACSNGVYLLRFLNEKESFVVKKVILVGEK